jgi:hypothetical protein
MSMMVDLGWGAQAEISTLLPSLIDLPAALVAGRSWIQRTDRSSLLGCIRVENEAGLRGL